MQRLVGSQIGSGLIIYSSKSLTRQLANYLAIPFKWLPGKLFRSFFTSSLDNLFDKVTASPRKLRALITGIPQYLSSIASVFVTEPTIRHANLPSVLLFEINFSWDKFPYDKNVVVLLKMFERERRERNLTSFSLYVKNADVRTLISFCCNTSEKHFEITTQLVLKNSQLLLKKFTEKLSHSQWGKRIDGRRTEYITISIFSPFLHFFFFFVLCKLKIIMIRKIRLSLKWDAGISLNTQGRLL